MSPLAKRSWAARRRSSPRSKRLTRRRRASCRCSSARWMLVWWTPDFWGLLSRAWWRNHWERTGIMKIDVADAMPDGWQRWLDWHRVIAPNNELEIKALKADGGDYLEIGR